MVGFLFGKECRQITQSESVIYVHMILEEVTTANRVQRLLTTTHYKNRPSQNILAFYLSRGKGY